MATYKVIQDIEAEDKLLGPLTLKQFIYAGITVVCLYLCFLGISKGVPELLIFFLPPALIAGFFAWPWSLNQPTEVWALAKIRFLLKPRRRIWDQSGAKELVTITAPKKVEAHFGSGLSQTEVKSRLQALADTIDSRGWAIKNVNVNLYAQPSAVLSSEGSDRLIDASSLPQEVPAIDVPAADDIMDEANNPIAQHFDQMVHAASDAHRQRIVSQLHQAAAASNQPDPSTTQPNDYWFLNQPAVSSPPPDPGYVTFNSQLVAPGSSDNDLPAAPAPPTVDEEALAERLKVNAHKPEISYSHLRTIQPLGSSSAQNAPAQPVTQAPDPAILGLAGDNDKNVATIARMAHETHKPEPPDEVVVPLH